MGKTRAEVQKAYRERKKAKEGASYLKKETERVKKYYKPTTDISPHQLKIRRERIRKCVRKKRLEEKRAVTEEPVQEREANPEPLVVESNNEGGPCDSTTAPATASTSAAEMETDTGTLVVNMKFRQNKSDTWKKRARAARKRSNEKMKTLEQRISSLKRRNEALKKRLQRTQKKSREEPRSIIKKHQDLTPKTRSREMLRTEGISPRKHEKLVKRLMFHNSIVDEVKERINPVRGRSRQRSALQIVCGKVMRKYRMKSKCSRELGVSRRQVVKAEMKANIVKRRKVLERDQMKTSVRSFLEREDNSACLPGKRDSMKSKGVTAQSRVLNDYLYNLHLKFKSENPSQTISLTTFASYRPAYIKLVKYTARRTCLCQKHQNIALKVKGLKAVGATTTESPDALIRQNSDDEVITKIEQCGADIIKFAEWKRKEVNYKGKMTKRMVIETVQMSKLEFIDMFRRDLREFRKHTERVKCQYEQIKALKDKMPYKHALCQMDFAENYSCGHAEEIQTAYFDKCSVTLHPVVIYEKGPEGIMTHTSYIYVSNTAQI